MTTSRVLRVALLGGTLLAAAVAPLARADTTAEPGPVAGTRITEAYARMVARETLPAPKDADLSLYVRAYWPEAAITTGQWTPPAVVKAP